MKKLTFLLGVIITLILTPVTMTKAADSESGAGFTLGIQAPGSEQTSYFKTKAEPGSQQTIDLTINNTTNKSSDFELTVINAGTSSSGTLVYSPQATTVNNFKQRLPELLTPTKQSITVKPQSSKVVTYTLTIPDTGISGDLLGAIYVRKETEKQESSGMGITNAFAMAMPIHVYGEDQRQVMPKLSLADTKLDHSGSNSVIETKLANAAARLFGQITIKSQVVNAAGKTVAKTELKNAEMAPSAVMTHSIPVKTEKLAAGKYTLKTSVASGAKTYRLTDEFTVKSDTIKKVATAIDYSPKDNNWLQWALVGLAAVIVMLVATLIVVLRKKKGANS